MKNNKKIKKFNKKVQKLRGLMLELPEITKEYVKEWEKSKNEKK